MGYTNLQRDEYRKEVANRTRLLFSSSPAKSYLLLYTDHLKDTALGKQDTKCKWVALPGNLIHGCSRLVGWPAGVTSIGPNWVLHHLSPPDLKLLMTALDPTEPEGIKMIDWDRGKSDIYEGMFPGIDLCADELILAETSPGYLEIPLVIDSNMDVILRIKDMLSSSPILLKTSALSTQVDPEMHPLDKARVMKAQVQQSRRTKRRRGSISCDDNPTDARPLKISKRSQHHSVKTNHPVLPTPTNPLPANTNHTHPTHQQIPNIRSQPEHLTEQLVKVHTSKDRRCVDRDDDDATIVGSEAQGSHYSQPAEHLDIRDAERHNIIPMDWNSRSGRTFDKRYLGQGDTYRDMRPERAFQPRQHRNWNGSDGGYRGTREPSYDDQQPRHTPYNHPWNHERGQLHANHRDNTLYWDDHQGTPEFDHEHDGRYGYDYGARRRFPGGSRY